MITDKDIQNAIETCIWRKDIGGVWVCAGDVVPCLKHIDEGKCDTLVRLFEKEANNEKGADDGRLTDLYFEKTPQ